MFGVPPILRNRFATSYCQVYSRVQIEIKVYRYTVDIYYICPLAGQFDDIIYI